MPSFNTSSNLNVQIFGSVLNCQSSHQYGVKYKLVNKFQASINALCCPWNDIMKANNSKHLTSGSRSMNFKHADRCAIGSPESLLAVPWVRSAQVQTFASLIACFFSVKISWFNPFFSSRARSKTLQ
jgi:hypothetical protein